MAHATEWTVSLSKDERGAVLVGLYEVGDDSQLAFVDAAEFGPFDTAMDITQWLTRHWAPRARMPLR